MADDMIRLRASGPGDPIHDDLAVLAAEWGGLKPMDTSSVIREAVRRAREQVRPRAGGRPKKSRKKSGGSP